MPRPEDDPAYTKNTKEQYESLGRFVEAFEAMVNEARICGIDLLTLGLTAARRGLISIPLYHQSLSAKPIFDIFRAICLELLNDKDFQRKHKITQAEVQKFASVLAAINGEYEWLANKRNMLLHATWFVGYLDMGNPTSETFDAIKWTISKTGVTRLDLPRTAKELTALRERCEQTKSWIAALHACLPTSKVDLTLDQCFKLQGGTWERIWPSRHKFPSKKS